VGVGPGARALVTTPAATKVYRSDGRRALQTQRLSVARGAALEWLPQETIIFDGAFACLETSVVLEPGALFVGWEVLCLGRPSIGERFRVGRCRTRCEVHVGATPLYVDRAVWEGGSNVLRGPHGLGGHAAFGTMLVVGARSGWLDVVRDLVAASSSRSHLSATLLGQGELLVCRYLGPSACRARESFADIWAALRPRWLGRVAVPPRIWST
jgi:urease accessory protein